MREARATNQDDMSIKTLSGMCVELQHGGYPLEWPCNTIESGSAQLDGGEFVDTLDDKFAVEAIAILKSDLADSGCLYEIDSWMCEVGISALYITCSCATGPARL